MDTVTCQVRRACCLTCSPKLGAERIARPCYTLQTSENRTNVVILSLLISFPIFYSVLQNAPMFISL